jgi:ribosomal protein L4
MVEQLKSLGLPARGVLVVLGGRDAALERAGRNLPHVKVVAVPGLAVRDVLAHPHLVMTRDALAQVVARLGTTRDGAA